MILHIVNLTSEAAWRAAVDELIRVGLFKVKVRLPEQAGRRRARLLVASVTRPVTIQRGFAVIDVEGILDHEVMVVE